MVADLGNKKLIERYEVLGIELNNIFIELATRRKNKELTEVEWSCVCEFASRRGSELVDYFNLNKRDMKDGLLEIVDILSDDTR